MQLGLYQRSPDGATLATLVLDLSRRLLSGTVTTSPHGDAELTAVVRMRRISEQFRIYTRQGGLILALSDRGAPIWIGRLEEVALGDGTISLTAYGAWRALSDIRHTALWSTTQVSGFHETLGSQIGGRNSKPYTMDTNNRVFIGLNKGATYITATNVGDQSYGIPSQSERQIQNVAFDYAVILPANWEVRCEVRDSAYGSSVTAWSLTATAGTQVGSVCVDLTANPRARVHFLIFNNTGANYTWAGEDGQNFASFFAIRLTTQQLPVNTTVASGGGLGATTVVVASAADIAIGQILYFMNGPNPQKGTVTGLAGTTITFTPALANALSVGDPVRGQRVLSTSIARRIAVLANAANPTEIRAGQTAIERSTEDLTDVVYLDADPAAALDLLALREGRTIRVLDRVLTYQSLIEPARRPQTWAVDIAALGVTRSLDAVRNRVYAVYEDASGDAVRADKTAAAANDPPSQRRWGIVRESALSVDTTNATLAGTLAATALADSADPAPQVQLQIRRVVTDYGARVDPWRVRAGDTLTIRNIARSLASDIDEIAVFRVARTEYDLITRQLTVEGETPPDTLPAVLARLEAAIG